MGIDWTEIATTLISIAGTIVSGFVVWFLKELVGKTRVNKANELLKKYNLEFLLKQTWVLEAVRYAEQVLNDKNGPQKYDAVMEFVSKKAKEHGIDLTPQELKVLIEAQLNKLREGAKQGWTEIQTQNPVIVTDPSKAIDSQIDSSFLIDHNNLNK